MAEASSGMWGFFFHSAAEELPATKCRRDEEQSFCWDDAQMRFPLRTFASGSNKDGDVAGVTLLANNKMSIYELL